MFEMEPPTISYTKIEDARGRRLKLRINRKGELIVNVPRHTPTIIVNRFINQNLDWIVQQQAKVSSAKVLPDDQILLFGKIYRIQLVYEVDKRSGCTMAGDQLIINAMTADAQLSDANVQRILTRFLRSSASHYILQRVPHWAEKMQIKYGKVQLRQQRSRWGSCSGTGTLNFNWRLAHAPPAVVDYVIIHELAHRQEMNHSARFWQLVASFDPAYQRHRGWLKREGRLVIPDSTEAD